MAPNQYILAADNSPALLPLLRANPELAREQDEHGYSLIHAAASYNHLELLRTLVTELKVPVDLRDEDNETALFVVETVDSARCLVEELGLDPSLRGDDGLTAAEKIAGEAEFPQVAEYLMGLQSVLAAANDVLKEGELPPPPEGMRVTMGAMPVATVETAEQGDGGESSNSGINNNDNGGEGSSANAFDDALGGQPDPELRRRIEELAARPDFHTEQGQAALRQLVQDALLGQDLTEDRNVRPRQD
ncbi:uncharacterized protein SPSK_07929 [Sporothrix schenckii 1099-18]|uniref:Uncharacterized protein n=2 Tax=Sporothrix schenckii TaxID=29908 RepID=U7Q410_SPOS1|nr:uncharacterized protein SPSK_07929 [Sporothrix schenckii 1099-18]ERT01426.1 hypothetical protein HMPREF1624_02672 [Sporothrix schenckii ATCC 58251]KJR88617.1 hypothetical protein SPSK_07929 [Sporothrix schenckii 1099-18]